MKISTTQTPAGFTPVTFTLVLETKEELQMFQNLVDNPCGIASEIADEYKVNYSSMVDFLSKIKTSLWNFNHD